MKFAEGSATDLDETGTTIDPDEVEAAQDTRSLIEDALDEPAVVDPSPQPADTGAAGDQSGSDQTGGDHGTERTGVERVVEEECLRTRRALDVAAADLASRLERLENRMVEQSRLRERDTEVIDKLHAENTRLRSGEHAKILKPLVMSLLRLHDQMAALEDGDEHSDAAMLRAQLVQALEMSAGVTSYSPEAGQPFDSARHFGAGRRVATEPAADNTVHRTLKAGFTSADGAVLRPAEVEVERYERDR